MCFPVWGMNVTPPRQWEEPISPIAQQGSDQMQFIGGYWFNRNEMIFMVFPSPEFPVMILNK